MVEFAASTQLTGATTLIGQAWYEAAVAAVELIESIRATGASIGWRAGASVTFLADVGREWPVELRQILRESNGYEVICNQIN